MKQSRYTEEPTVDVPEESEAGLKTGELCTAWLWADWNCPCYASEE